MHKPTVASVIAMFESATTERHRDRAKDAGARLAVADQLLVVDAAIESYHRVWPRHFA